MPRVLKLLVALVPFFFVLACVDSNKAPAEAAIKAGETELAKLGPDASTYAPDGVAAARKSLATAKELAGNKEYEGALKAASAIPAKVSEVLASVAARKAEAKAWSDSAARVASSLSAIRSRLDALHKEKRLPAGIDKAVLAKAHEEVASVESGLAKLSDDAKGGKVAEAIAGAKDLQAKADGIAKTLAM